MTHFARALGNAHLGRIAEARTDIEMLESLSASTAESAPYWSKQIDIQAHAARAWVEQMQGNERAALVAMQRAADLEASTEKSPTTPGELLPARELLGDLHLLQGNAAAALEAYDMSLARSPRRLNSVLGAERAARMAGLEQEAAAYRSELIAFVDPGTSRAGVTRILSGGT